MVVQQHFIWYPVQIRPPAEQEERRKHEKGNCLNTSCSSHIMYRHTIYIHIIIIVIIIAITMVIIIIIF